MKACRQLARALDGASLENVASNFLPVERIVHPDQSKVARQAHRNLVSCLPLWTPAIGYESDYARVTEEWLIGIHCSTSTKSLVRPEHGNAESVRF